MYPPLLRRFSKGKRRFFCIEKRPISRLSSVFVVYNRKSQSKLHGVFGDDYDLFVFVFNERCRSNEQDDRHEQ